MSDDGNDAGGEKAVDAGAGRPASPPRPGGRGQWDGLTVASAAIGLFCLVSAVVGWVLLLAAWRHAATPSGWFAYAPLHPGQRFTAPTGPSGRGPDARWLLVLPAAAVGLLFARVAGRQRGRAHQGPVPGTRAGTWTNIAALVLGTGLLAAVVLTMAAPGTYLLR